VELVALEASPLSAGSPSSVVEVDPESVPSPLSASPAESPAVDGPHAKSKMQSERWAKHHHASWQDMRPA
jgi:hypothetical protein